MDLNKVKKFGFFLGKQVIKIVLFLIAVYIPLRSLSIHHYSIWTDFTGTFDSILSPAKYFYVIIENNFGRVFANKTSILLYVAGLKILYSFFNLKLATFLAFYLNILATLVLIYLLIRELLGKYNNFLINIGLSLIFLYSPVYIYHAIGVATLPFIMSINGLILSFLFFKKYEGSGNNIYLYLIGLSSCFVIHPFVFIFYLLILSWIFIINKHYKLFFFLIAFTILLNLYWVGPFLYSFIFDKSTTILNESTNALISINASYIRLIKSFLFSPRDIAENILPSYLGIYTYPVLILFLLLWIISIVSLLIHRSRENLGIFTLILLLILFSVGPTEPLGFLYNFLLSNFKFFGFFRSFININLINLLLLLIFFAAVLKASARNVLMKSYVIIFSIILGLSAFNFFQNVPVSPVLEIPKEYFDLQRYIYDQKDDFYILYIPYTQYKQYKWAQDMTGKNIILNFFSRGLVTNYDGEDYLLKKEGQIYSYLNLNTDFSKYLGENSIKYIIYDKSLINSYNNPMFVLNNPNRFEENFIEGLDLEISNRFFRVYRVKDELFYPKIVGQDVKYQKISPTKYKINITVRDNTILTFNTILDKNWNLFIQRVNPDWCKKTVFYKKNTNLSECSPNINSELLNLEDLQYLFQKSDFNNVGNQMKQFPINKWSISVEQIKKNINITQLKKEGYPKKTNNNSLDWKYFIENPDGSIEVTLLLYYKSQALFLLTAIISAITAVSFLLIIVYKLVSFSVYQQKAKNSRLSFFNRG